MMNTNAKILKERARITALKKESDATSGNRLVIVEFLLFPEKYAVEARFVHEVLSLKEITPIPGTPDFIMGVINFRGAIISVINLKSLFGLREKGLTEMNKVVLLSNGEMEFGLIADGILGSGEIFEFQITEPPHNLSKLGSEFISGLLPNGTILLNANELLQSKTLQISQ